MLYAENTASTARPMESGNVFCAPAVETTTVIPSAAAVIPSEAVVIPSEARDLLFIPASRVLENVTLCRPERSEGPPLGARPLILNHASTRPDPHARRRDLRRLANARSAHLLPRRHASRKQRPRPFVVGRDLLRPPRRRQPQRQLDPRVERDDLSHRPAGEGD